jgi:hypothetical protein
VQRQQRVRIFSRNPGIRIASPDERELAFFVDGDGCPDADAGSRGCVVGRGVEAPTLGTGLRIQTDHTAPERIGRLHLFFAGGDADYDQILRLDVDRGAPQVRLGVRIDLLRPLLGALAAFERVDPAVVVGHEYLRSGDRG